MPQITVCAYDTFHVFGQKVYRAIFNLPAAGELLGHITYELVAEAPNKTQAERIKRDLYRQAREVRWAEMEQRERSNA